MQERIEAAFEYAMDHPEALMILGGMFFAFISIFTPAVSAETTSFLRLISIALLVVGVILYVLHLGLRFIIRIFRKIFHMHITFDDDKPNSA